ncbi:MAG: hypothetical protein VKJ46_00975 [Leptolyngbyaceae bacterium]|nr:hypothetical protein [Leptolyngbyaceae bacterium]
MALNEFRWWIPVPPTEAEVFRSLRFTHDFYREVQYRKVFQHHCEEYQALAQRHRQELQKMRGDINVLGWFYRGSRR